MPDKTVRTEYNTPASGSLEWWGGSADGLNNTLTRSITIPAGATASLSAKAWYEIEAGYDYLFAEVQTAGSTSWTQVGAPVDGQSDADLDGVTDWVDLSYDLSAYAGQTVTFRFRYATDGGLHFAGPFLDATAVTINGTTTADPDDVAGPGPRPASPRCRATPWWRASRTSTSRRTGSTSVTTRR
ncbi:hypothetical protein ACFQX7_17955 [Luedemannella flava]